MESLLKRLAEEGESPVYQALLQTDRAHYVPSLYVPEAHLDRPVPIGHNATISAPHMHLFACQHLHNYCQSASLTANAEIRVLDVGSGSGYLVAAFARLLELLLFRRFLVVGVEHVPEVAAQSRVSLNRDLQDHELLTKVQVITGDGYEGWSKEAPYDFIHVGAACPTIPSALVEQLKVNGVMVLPVNDDSGYQMMRVLRKDSSGQLKPIGEPLPVRYVPLTDLETQKRL